MKQEMQPLYTSRIRDLCEVYIKDGIVLKDRWGKCDLRSGINNYRDIVIENNGIVNIYCTDDMATQYENEIEHLKGFSSAIDNKIKVHTPSTCK